MKNRHRLSAALMVAIAALLLGVGAAPAFGQNGSQTGGPDPITEYAGYPSGVIPASCTAEGPAILTGTQYSMNGGAPVSDMEQLGNVPNTATITMTWDGFAPGCEGVGVSLSRKISPSVGFVVSEDQHMNTWAYCGPGGTACDGTLTLNLAQATPVACYQLDAAAGPPLSVVGPSGSYYSGTLNGVRNVLLSANNGGTEPCTIEPCATNPSVPAAAAACEEVVATSTSTTTTPVAPSSTAAAPCADNQVRDATTGQCVTPAQVRAGGAQLPVTGDRTGDFTTAGLALFGAGLLLVGATRRIVLANREG